MEVEEDDDVGMDNEGDQDSDYENNNIGVIVLFYVTKKIAYQLNQLRDFRQMMVMKYKTCHLTVSKVLKVLKVYKVI